MSHGGGLRDDVADLLNRHWDDQRSWCVPNPSTYPHLWLWDSCFHAIIWARLGDERAARELRAVVSGPAPRGMVPHMRFGGGPADTWLGPSATESAITQPPIYAHAARVLTDAGFAIPSDVIEAMRAGLDWLWRERRTDDGLLVVVHPWETGNDHSPRFDDWFDPNLPPQQHERAARTAWNKALMHEVVIEGGAARWSTRFVVATAGFNAYAAHAMSEFAALTGDTVMAARSIELAQAIDDVLWNDDEGLWDDLGVVGGGPSTSIPISDGIMPALVTTDREKATRALAQLTNPDRFGAPFGPANVVRSHPRYDPDTYWRGPAWPPLNYLFSLALLRWGADEAAEAIGRQTRRAVESNGWAEYWNPETGGGRGAAPQSWSGLVVAMAPWQS